VIPTSALKNLPLASSDPVVEITNESIELDVDDLLDIDGSDDQTLAVSKGLAHKIAKRLAAPKRNARTNVVPAAAPSEPDDSRATIPFGLEKHAPKSTSAMTPRMSTVSSPAHFAFAAVPPRNPKASVRDAGSTFEPVSTSSAPAHFAAQPRVRTVSASYPPIAIAIAGREKALSFIQERPSRAGWIAAAVIAVVLLIGGSMRVQSSALPSSATQPAELTPLPAAVEPEAPKPVEVAIPKVVQFGDDQGVAIKPSAKPSASPAKHAAAPAKPTTKPAPSAKLADGSLALTDSKTEKKPESKPADKKKPAQTIDAELAELQLRAAAR